MLLVSLLRLLKNQNTGCCKKFCRMMSSFFPVSYTHLAWVPAKGRHFLRDFLTDFGRESFAINEMHGAQNKRNSPPRRVEAGNEGQGARGFATKGANPPFGAWMIMPWRACMVTMERRRLDRRQP